MKSKKKIILILLLIIICIVGVYLYTIIKDAKPNMSGGNFAESGEFDMGSNVNPDKNCLLNIKVSLIYGKPRENEVFNINTVDIKSFKSQTNGYDEINSDEELTVKVVDDDLNTISEFKVSDKKDISKFIMIPKGKRYIIRLCGSNNVMGFYYCETKEYLL